MRALKYIHIQKPQYYVVMFTKAHRKGIVWKPS